MFFSNVKLMTNSNFFVAAASPPKKECITSYKYKNGILNGSYNALLGPAGLNLVSLPLYFDSKGINVYTNTNNFNSRRGMFP